MPIEIKKLNNIYIDHKINNVYFTKGECKMKKSSVAAFS